jgi:PiT family inorganic phosphate transporter
MIIMGVIYYSLQHAALSKIRNAFSRLQIASAAFMAFSHGSNDGQKFMGVFSLALVLGGAIDKFEVSWIVMLICGTIMGLGTISGGWRIIKTLGFKLTHLEPVNGFAAETSASAAILLGSHFGIPLSTTHCITTAIMGVGASRRFSAVRWGMAGSIIMTWIITFPICGMMGYAFYYLMNWIF